jgi:hypothetical protein
MGVRARRTRVGHDRAADVPRHVNEVRWSGADAPRSGYDVDPVLGGHPLDALHFVARGSTICHPRITPIAICSSGSYSWHAVGRGVPLGVRDCDFLGDREHLVQHLERADRNAFRAAIGRPCTSACRTRISAGS